MAEYIKNQLDKELDAMERKNLISNQHMVMKMYITKGGSLRHLIM